MNLAQSEKQQLDQQNHMNTLKLGSTQRPNLAKQLPPLDHFDKQTYDEDTAGEEDNPQKPVKDFEQRNLDKLKAMQEAKIREMKMIEDERAKMLRR